MIRRTCALAGLLVLFLQGSSGGHMILVEHTRCAQHGALVHGGESHTHEGPTRQDTDAVTVHGASQGSSDGSHEHCSLAADRRESFLAVVETAPAASPCEAALQCFPPADAFVGIGTARFRVAPKNSPPA